MVKRVIKNLRFGVIAFGAILFCSNVNGQDTLHLTLPQALEIALSENLTVKVADKEIKKSEYAKKGSYAQLFPQVDFSADYQRTIKKQTMYMGDQAIQFGRDNSWSTGFSLGMPLVSATLWNSLKISAMDVELSVEKAKSSKQQLIDEVQQSFYAVLLAYDTYNVYKENYDNSVTSYNEVKQKYDRGKTSKYDLIRAEVTMQNAKPQVFDAQNSIILAHWKLKALIGVDMNSEIKCAGNLSDYTNMVKEMINVDTSLDNNSDLKQLNIQEKILDQTYKMQLSKYYPSLNLSLFYNWSAMTDNFKFSTFRWNPYSTGALSLKIPIFSGGQRYNAVKQTKVQQEQLILQRENTIRNLEVGVKQTLSSMETCLKQYEAAQMGVEGADAGYKIAQKRYEIGSGTILELLDAQVALLQAKLNVNHSIYNYLISKSTLERILGMNNVE